MPDLAPTMRMADGTDIPRLGLGVMFISDDDLPGIVGEAVRSGYRHFDTATHYGNEARLGESIGRLDVDRSTLFVTTKLPDSHHGHDEALRAFDASERALGRIDLYLIHWPQPARQRYVASWKALVRLREERRVRSIGVANFPPSLIDELAAETGVAPAVNQIELHLRFQQRQARAFHTARGILTQAWSPLAHGGSLDLPALTEIARKHDRTPAQIALAWHLRNGLIAIPKTATPARLRENFAALDISLDEDDLAALDALDDPAGRFGPEPLADRPPR